MITEADQKERLRKLVESIEIPRSYYERAVARYRSIGDWLCRDEGTTAQYKPSVSPQGSFRLGLVNRPIGPKEEYDLDIVCEFGALSKELLTQEQLKAILGREIDNYAKAHGIIEPVTESKRCWRIDYADEVKFHIDNLPCVPENSESILSLIALGVNATLAQTAIGITCKEHYAYKLVSPNWPTGNPTGYARWFEQRFGIAALEKRRVLVEAGAYASVDEVPTYALKTPLQQAIQILKRHRDFMFKAEPALRPISIILTTLSALAYQGEGDLFTTIAGILERMPQYIRAARPRVPNPVNPGEDFADKWAAKPVLEENFWLWYEQAASDFDALTTNPDQQNVLKIGETKFGASIQIDSRAPATVRRSARVVPASFIENGPRPWG